MFFPIPTETLINNRISYFMSIYGRLFHTFGLVCLYTQPGKWFSRFINDAFLLDKPADGSLTTSLMISWSPDVIGVVLDGQST